MRLDLVFPRFTLLSGAERAILGLAGALARQGHEPRLVCHQFDPSCRARLAPGVGLACTGARLDWTSNRYLNAVFDYVRAWQLGPSLDPRSDVQLFFGPSLPLAWYLRRVSRSGAVVLYYCWEPPRVLYQDREEVLGRLGRLALPMGPALAAYRLWDRVQVAAVDGVCTSSRFAAGRVLECYGRPATVITLGVDRDRLDAARRPLPPGRPRFLTVNYLHPRKRVDLLVEALALLLEGRHPPGNRSPTAADPGGPREPRPLLVVVGDGPERDSLQELVRRRGLQKDVEFAGFVADDELPRYYWEATCYLHGAREESFGLSVIEAAYCARPVVTVDEGGVRETVEDGVTGYRVKATPEAVAERMARMLALPDRGRGLGEAGRRRVGSRYRWERGAEELVGLARSLGR